MTPAETSRLKRSYARNLGWCRFWLGISLAIVTLMFTFAVNQVFKPLIERAPVPTIIDEQRDAGDDGQVEPLRFPGVTVMFALFLVTSICIGLSAYFRVLYRRDDAALTNTERGHQEATT